MRVVAGYNGLQYVIIVNAMLGWWFCLYDVATLPPTLLVSTH